MIPLQTGLNDLSTELGEVTTDTSTPRITHYNNAVIDFCNERKWPFLLKTGTPNPALVDVTKQQYSITNLTDLRLPGGIKGVVFSSNPNIPLSPVAWEDLPLKVSDDKQFVWMDLEETSINFNLPLTNAGDTIILHYFSLPARTTDLVSGSFAIPDRYRKSVAMLAAAYVQWSRYLDDEGNRLYNLYGRSLGKITDQQAERPSNLKRKLPHILAYVGFRRRYP